MNKFGKIRYGVLILVVLLTSAWIYPFVSAAMQISKAGELFNTIVANAGLDTAASLCIYRVQNAPIDLPALEEAEENLKQAVQHRPEDPYPTYLLGKIDCLRGDYEAAVLNFDAFIEARPDNPLGYLDRSFAVESQCRQGEARTFQLFPALEAYQVCRDAFVVDQLLDDWYFAGIELPHLMARGRSASESGSLSESLEWYGRAAILDPESIIPWVQAGDLYYREEMWSEAVQAYEVVEPRVNNRDVSYKLGYARYQIQAFEAAAVSFENAVNLSAGAIGLSNVYYFLGLAIDSLPVDNSTIESAITAYSQAIDLNDYTEETWRRSDAYYRRGVLFLKIRETEAAREEFETALAINPVHYWAHVFMARVFRIEGMVEEALEYANKAIEIRPQSKGAYRFLGEYYLETGALDLANEMYSTILTIDPNDEDALLILEDLGQ